MSDVAMALDPCAVRDPVSIAFVAVGNAGIRLIRHLPERIPELGYVAVDTDRAALADSPFPRKLLVGEAQTGGLGTGSNPNLARSCAENQDDALMRLLDGYKVILLVCGLGGGTGGGIGPYLAERAKDRGLIVLAAVVRPLEAEGGHRRHAADAALALFREHCHAVSLFPLDALRQDAGADELPLPKLIRRCGNEIGRALGGLAVLLRGGWLIPLTLQDLIQVMQRADGYFRLAAVSADGDQRFSDAVDALFTHPLLDRGSVLAHGSGVVLGILCGPGVTVRELEQITLELRAVLRTDAELKIGVAQDERFGSHVGLVAMVSERWSTRPVPLDVLPHSEVPEGAADGKPKSSRLVQSEIELNHASRGRFKGAEPTLIEGMDLDTPTFIRKGIRLGAQPMDRGGD